MYIMSEEKCNIVKDTRTVDEKIARLRKLGVRVSVMDSKKKPKDGYILGRMKDRYPNLKI